MIDYRRTVFSQSGEDGIIARVFEIIGHGNRFCCEFGAWDGIRLSNTRALILEGWSALLIEADPERFRELCANYTKGGVVCENATVDTGRDSLANILNRTSLSDRRLDLLSIDIDGLDYEIFATLDQLRALPRLVVVEVQPEHGPDSVELLPSLVARHNIGQPLSAFVAEGERLGYRLICYFGGNAFFLANDAGEHSEFPTLSALNAWDDWYATITQSDADYLFMRNIGLNAGDYCFDNPRLSADGLGIPRWRFEQITCKRFARRIRNAIRSVIRPSK